MAMHEKILFYKKFCIILSKLGMNLTGPEWVTKEKGEEVVLDT